jgi:hypothetical protein
LSTNAEKETNTGKLFCFNNNVSNLYNNSVVEKINGMAWPSSEYSCGKRNPLYPIRAASFVSIALYVIFKPRPIYFR